MVIPASRFVAAGIELPVDEYGPAWTWLMGTWFPASGYPPDDRPFFEGSLNDPEEHPQKLRLVELWEPVRPRCAPAARTGRTFEVLPAASRSW